MRSDPSRIYDDASRSPASTMHARTANIASDGQWGAIQVSWDVKDIAACAQRSG